MISEEGFKRLAKSAMALYESLIEEAKFSPDVALDLTIAAMPALVGRV